jgi:hypothetical protein
MKWYQSRHLELARETNCSGLYMTPSNPFMEPNKRTLLATECLFLLTPTVWNFSKWMDTDMAQS